MYVAGIDEAGRGPVIGPMVMTIAVLKVEDLEILEDLGVKDSKLISPVKREKIYYELKDLLVEHITIKESAKNIDKKRKQYSLNILEAKMASSLINSLKTEPKKIYVDCPDTNPLKYRDILYSYLDKHYDLVVEHKADLNYLIVGAASIIAKVERDFAIKKIEEKENVEIGSGYPSDPKTKLFIENVVKKGVIPDYVRQSWQTFANAETKQKQRRLYG